MVTIGSAIDLFLNLVVLVSAILYVYTQFVLYWMLKRRAKEKLSSYLFIVFFSGFVNLAVILNQVIFQLLPSFVLQTFFYSLGSGGARFSYMLNFGCEVFIIACEGFVAISRYLTFIRNDMSNNYWSLARVRLWLFGISAASLAYALLYFLCPFTVMWGADKASVRFLFAKDNTINWVGASIFVPFALVVASWFSCVYCYYKVATIIRGSQTGLTKGIVAKMCLSSTIITFGAFLSLLVRIMNHISYLVGDYDVIPLLLFLTINRIGALIATCGNPWILLSLFPVVREEAFPCIRQKLSSSTIIVSATLHSRQTKSVHE